MVDTITHSFTQAGQSDRTDTFQTTASGVSVVQVGRRYAMNANMNLKWLRNPRYVPDPEMFVGVLRLRRPSYARKLVTA